MGGYTQLLRYFHRNYLLLKLLFFTIGLLVVYIIIINFSELKRTGEDSKVLRYKDRRIRTDHGDIHINERSYVMPSHRADL